MLTLFYLVPFTVFEQENPQLKLFRAKTGNTNWALEVSLNWIYCYDPFVEYELCFQSSTFNSLSAHRVSYSF